MIRPYLPSSTLVDETSPVDEPLNSDQVTEGVQFAYSLPQQQSNQEDNQDDTGMCSSMCVCVRVGLCVHVYLCVSVCTYKLSSCSLCVFPAPPPPHTHTGC